MKFRNLTEEEMGNVKLVEVTVRKGTAAPPSLPRTEIRIQSDVVKLGDVIVSMRTDKYKFSGVHVIEKEGEGNIYRCTVSWVDKGGSENEL
jgi:hypothetical protein